MPKVTVTVRYKSFGDNDQSYLATLKKAQREKIKQDYPDATNLEQKIITDGIPDAVKFGDLRANGQLAVRTEFDVSEETAAALKKDMR